jgi:hypothetical protein
LGLRTGKRGRERRWQRERGEGGEGEGRVRYVDGHGKRGVYHLGKAVMCELEAYRLWLLQERCVATNCQFS